MHAAVVWRVTVTLVSIMVVQATVCAVAVAPSAWAWLWLFERTAASSTGVRVIAFSVATVPSYILFALCLMAASAAAARLTGARTSPNLEMRLAEMDWPLLSWARYMVGIQIVRLFAGRLFCGSPVWTAYLRLNGARLGRRVYVNTTSISDHNLLDVGDDVVVGADVHISGHTVERGILKTAGVRLGRHVTIGLGSTVEIDVEVGEGCEIGAMSFVPKHARLESGGVYVGVPVRRIAPSHARESDGHPA